MKYFRVLFVMILLLAYSVVQAGIPGDLDSSFGGGDGITTNIPGTLSNSGNAIALQSDGKIVVAGDDQENFVVQRYLANGTLDTTFGGGDGVVKTNFGGEEEALDLAVLPDGKILVVGGESEYGYIAMARYNPDGTLDKTFGPAGTGKIKKLLAPTYGGGATGVAVAPSGKFYVSVSIFELAANDYHFTLLRFNPNGTLDNTFSGDGIAQVDSPGGWDFTYDVAIQADGKPVIAGVAGNGGGIGIARFNLNGTPDNTFDGDGFAYSTLGSAYTLQLLPSGKMLVGGSFSGATGDFFIARFTSTGALDSTFGGGDGYVNEDFSSTSEYIRDIALLPDNSIIAVGTQGGASGEIIAMARFTSAGVLDSEFFGGGWRTYTFGGYYNSANAVVVQPNGKFVVTGYGNDANDDSLLYVARFHNETIINAGLDIDKAKNGVPDFWKPSRLTNDTLACANVTVVSAPCAFRFVGDSDGQTEVLQQIFNVKGYGGEGYDLVANIETNSIPAGSAKIVVTFMNGRTLVNTASIPVSDLNSAGYVQVSDQVLASGDYDRILVSVQFKGNSGRMLFDGLTLTQTIFVARDELAWPDVP